MKGYGLFGFLEIFITKPISILGAITKSRHIYSKDPHTLPKLVVQDRWMEVLSA